MEAKFANFLGVLIVAFGMIVFGILSKAQWQRPETDESAYVSILYERYDRSRQKYVILV